MSMATNSSIWKREFSIVMLNAISEQTLVSHLGIEFTEFGEDYLSASMPVEARTRQPLGKLHGGAAVVLAETLASTAASLCVDGTDKCVGIEINANHIRSVTTGSVTGTTPAHTYRRLDTRMGDGRQGPGGTRRECRANDHRSAQKSVGTVRASYRFSRSQTARRYCSEKSICRSVQTRSTVKPARFDISANSSGSYLCEYSVQMDSPSARLMSSPPTVTL